jgi:hypothetical protein
MHTITQFPTNPERFVAVRRALQERRKSTGASTDRLRLALGVAFDCLRSGSSAALAIQFGYQCLRGDIQHIPAGSGPEVA